MSVRDLCVLPKRTSFQACRYMTCVCCQNGRHFKHVGMLLVCVAKTDVISIMSIRDLCVLPVPRHDALMEMEEAAEQDVLRSQLWATLFRGGFMVGKLQRSLSGRYVSHMEAKTINDKCTVNKLHRNDPWGPSSKIVELVLAICISRSLNQKK